MTVHAVPVQDAEEAADGTLARPRAPSRWPAASGPEEATALSPAPSPAGDTASRVRGFLGRARLPEGSLLHARPVSLHESRASHHEAARRWEAGLIRWPRIAWGYLHLLIRSVLFGVDWVLATPSRFFVTVAVLAAAWYWH